MFSRQHWQIKLVYASFGALILFIGMLLSPVASLGNYEHGGVVKVKGKGEGEALMSINEYGNGTVFTRDTNGNPLK